MLNEIIEMLKILSLFQVDEGLLLYFPEKQRVWIRIKETIKLRAFQTFGYTLAFAMFFILFKLYVLFWKAIMTVVEIIILGPKVI